MEFDYIEWDDGGDPRGNTAHIEAAGVLPEEVEEVLRGPGPESISRSSGRPSKSGWTSTGKYLFVVHEMTSEAGITVIYPVSSYEVDPP